MRRATLAAVMREFFIALAVAIVGVGPVRSVAQTGEQQPSGSEIRVDVTDEARTVTLRAHQVGRRTLLQLLAERARFKLQLPTDLADTPIDCDAAGLPIAGVVEALLKGVDYGYVMTLEPGSIGRPKSIVIARGPRTWATSDAPVPTAADSGSHAVVAADALQAPENPPAPPEDPIVAERYKKELSGSSIDDMLTMLEGSRADAPSSPLSSARGSGLPNEPATGIGSPARTLVASAPISPAGVPRLVPAPRASPWVPVSAADVNGGRK
ncbi:MAG TPA: hypothetical protein VGY48_23540 [Vicinamibacterales bacterium]|nr:hypothetical protein [Vicinamibacterales bacterium]